MEDVITLGKSTKTPSKKRSKKNNFVVNYSFLVSLKNLLSSIRLLNLELGYKIHVCIRKAHDLLYKRNKTYKKYSDLKYSSLFHKVLLASAVASFVFIVSAQLFWPSEKYFKPQPVSAGSAQVFWDTKTEFQNNGAANSNFTGATTSSNIDFDSPQGSVQLQSNGGQPVNLGDGSDGALVVDGVTAANNTLNGVLIPGGPFNNANPLVLDTKIVRTNRIYNFTTVTLQNSAVVTHTQGVGAGTQYPGITVRANSSITIAANSKIDVSSKGYGGGGQASIGGGPGGGCAGIDDWESNNACGGGYGGFGQFGSVGYTTFPALGSGGGGSYSGSFGWGYTGGNGGGSVVLESNSISLLGTIMAVGQEGQGNSSMIPGSGGGSGGSVYLLYTNGSIDASKINVSGGAGGSAAGGYPVGGFGGGGRVKISTLATPTGTPSIGPGSGVNAGSYQVVTPFKTQGTVSGFKVDAQKISKWQNLSWNGLALPSNTDIKFRTRITNVTAPTISTPVDQADIKNGWSAWSSFHVYSTVGVTSDITSITSGVSRWLEIEVVLDSNGAYSPNIDKIGISFDSLDTPGASNFSLSKTSDNAQLRKTNGSNIALIGNNESGGYTNETSIKVSSSNLTCNSCSGTLTGRKIEVQYKIIGSDFTGSEPIVLGDSRDDNLDGIFDSTAVITGLSSSGYQIRLRVSDDAGRQTDWVSYSSPLNTEADFIVEQQSPTITGFKVNNDAQYANTSTRVIVAKGIFNDTGSSSGTLEVQFSEDGSNWGIYNNDSQSPGNNKTTDWTNRILVQASGLEQTIPGAWYLEGSDGAKTVFVRTRDVAGGVSGDTDTETAQFLGIAGTGIGVLNDEVKLVSNPNASYSLNAPFAPNLVASTGVDEDTCDTSIDVSGTFTIPDATSVRITWNWTGGDGFSTPVYSRLFVNNTQVVIKAAHTAGSETTGWFSGNSVSVSLFVDENNCNGESGTATVTKIEYKSLLLPNSSPENTYSSVIDLGGNKVPLKMFWSDSVPQGTSLITEVRASNNVDLTGGLSWTPVAKGQQLNQIPAWQNYHYLEYRFVFITDVGRTITPVVYDVSIEISSIDMITLDVAAPSVFSLISPSNNIWQQSATPNLTWNASSDGNGIKEYQLYIDGTSTKTMPGTDTAANSSVLSSGNHLWKIRAIDNAGNYTDSNETWNLGFDAQAPANALHPSFASNFRASVTNNDDVTVAWNAYSDSGAPTNGSPAYSYTIEKIKTQWLEDNNINALTDDWSIEEQYNPNPGYYQFSPIISTAPRQLVVSKYAGLGDAPVDLVADSVRYTFRIKVTDRAGNTSTNYLTSAVGYNADTIPPTDPIPISSMPCDGNIATCPNTDPGDNALNEFGYSIKVTWGKSTDAGTGVTGYKIYRAHTQSPGYQQENLFELIGYVDILDPLSQTNPAMYTYFDNDDHNLQTNYQDTFAGQLTNIKPNPSSLLNDYYNNLSGQDILPTYYYRITAVDANGRESKVLPAISPDTPNIIDPVNSTQTSTIDVTKPSSPTDVSASALGIDGLPVPDGTDPKQKVEITWTISTDQNNQNFQRQPHGSGKGVDHYILYIAKSTVNGGKSPETNNANLVYQEVANDLNALASTYSLSQLDEMTYYYFKLVAHDKVNNYSQDSEIGSVKTLSSQVPTTPTDIRVEAIKGDPNEPATRVGKDINVSFKTSYIKYQANKITGYEVYRSKTNHGNNEAAWLGSTKVKEWTDLNIIGVDVPDEQYIQALPRMSFIDTIEGDLVESDVINYYYKVRAIGFNPTNDPNIVVSGLSSITTGTLNAGWDTVPDVTKPLSPTAIKAKDTFSTSTNLRNIITWSLPDMPLRKKTSYDTCETFVVISGVDYCSDFSRYEVTREIFNPSDMITPISKTTFNISDYNTNLYIDANISPDYKDFKIKYYIQVVDNAATNFKYNDAEKTIINSFSNYSDKLYADEIIVPAQTTPKLASNTEIVLKEVSVSSAIIEWSTDQPSDSLVEYRELGVPGEFIAVGDRIQAENHSVKIFDLKTDTPYEYRVVSRNKLGNDMVIDAVSYQSNYSKTLPSLRTAKFKIESVQKSETTSTVQFSWATSMPAKSNSIEWEVDDGSGNSQLRGIAGQLATGSEYDLLNHSVVLKGLKSNTKYRYKVKSISVDNYQAESPEGNNYYYFETKKFDSGQFTLSPSSSNVAERQITSTTAQIVWQTAEDTTSWVDYSTKSGIYDNSAGNDNLTRQHVVVLEGLVPGTTYYYRVRVKDINEVEYTSQEYTFKAILKPKISNMRVKDVTPYSITISWDTNVDTETLINWGKTASYGEKRGVSGLSKVHEIKVDGLEDNQEYHYQILAKDEAGNEVADEDKVIRTPLDKEGPKIENVKLDVLPMGEADATGQVIISWTTNKPATTMVEYDEGVIGGKYSFSTVEDKSLNTSHTVIVKELKPATSYHYRIVSKDKRENVTVSQDFTFVTPTKEKSILQLIIKSLEETFSWTKNLNQFFGNIGKRLTGN